MTICANGFMRYEHCPGKASIWPYDIYRMIIEKPAASGLAPDPQYPRQIRRMSYGFNPVHQANWLKSTIVVNMRNLF
jgi:hypothetical protein